MENDNTHISNEEIIQKISLPDLKQLILDMQPSGKINDIHAIRLFLLGIIVKMEDLKNDPPENPLFPYR